MESTAVNREELLSLNHQIDARITRVESEMDSLISVKKLVMSLVIIFTLQLGGFIYGYGGMSERLENTIRAVESNTSDRFYRTEALQMEQSLRRELSSIKTIADERKEIVHTKLDLLKEQIKKLEGK